MTVRDAPIANPTFCTYHVSLHLKWTLLTAMYKRRSIVLLDKSGGSFWLYIFLSAMSMASLSETFVYRFFTSREKILSSESNLVFSIITLAASVLVPIFAPSILSKKICECFFQFLIKTTGERERGPVVAV